MKSLTNLCLLSSRSVSSSYVVSGRIYGSPMNTLLVSHGLVDLAKVRFSSSTATATAAGKAPTTANTSSNIQASIASKPLSRANMDYVTAAPLKVLKIKDNELVGEAKMKRALRGIYAGKIVDFGNMRSHANNRFRRTWEPNVQTKRFKSDILNKEFKINITTHAMRCIKKAGSFDQFILYSKHIDDSTFALKLRKEMVIKLDGKIPKKKSIRVAKPPSASKSKSAIPPTTPAKAETKKKATTQ